MAQGGKSCSDIKAQCDKWCGSDKINMSSREHCYDHAKQSFDYCKKDGTWETFQYAQGRWCDAGKISGLEKR